MWSLFPLVGALFALTGYFASCAGLAAAGADPSSMAVMQGTTGQEQTQVFVLVSNTEEYRFSLHSDSHGKLLPFLSTRSRYGDSPQVMHRVLFKNLTAGAVYLFQVHRISGELVTERRVRTLAPGRQKLRFALASCMNDSFDQGDIWQQMLALRPDVIFLLGDNVYADKKIKGVKAIKPTKGKKQIVATPAELWRRQAETRNYISLFKSYDLIPVIATWDDHDYGKNDGGRNYRFKDESLAIFKSFFVSDQSDNFRVPGIGVASHFTIYGYNFFLLDNRTFRTVNATSPQKHFGAEQLQWLWRGLQGKDYAFLLSGDQFFGGYHDSDSFQGSHRRKFFDFLAKLRTLDSRVVFFSGDRHYAEIMRIPERMLRYQTYEFTTSPIHAKPDNISWNNPPNVLRVQGYDKTHNFMFVEATKGARQLSLQVSAHSHGGRVLFSGTYTVRR